MISSFPTQIQSNIFKHLHQSDLAALTLTCRDYHKMVREVEGIRKQAALIASFIFDNYQVLASSHLDLGELNFRNITLLVLGENAVVDKDRFLNAILINHCWQKHFQIFLEGDEETLEYTKRIGNGPCNYLSPNIIQKANTWDWASFDTQVLFAQYSALAKITFGIAYDLMNFSFEKQSFCIKKYVHFINKHFNKTQYKYMSQKLRFLKYPDKQYRLSSKTLLQLHFDTVNILFSEQVTIKKFLEFRFQECRQERENSLFSTMYISSLQGQSNIFVSKSSLMQSSNVLGQIEFLSDECRKQNPGKSNAPSILFLQPLTTTTFRSISKSYQKHFKCKPTPLPSASISANAHSVEILDSLKHQLSTINSEDFDRNRDLASIGLQCALAYLQHEGLRIHRIMEKKECSKKT